MGRPKKSKPQKQKKSKPKKTPKQPKMKMVKAPNHLIEAVCSNYDPFCNAALGAKLHDRNTAPSLTFCSRNLVDVQTNAQGRAMVWMSVDPQLGIATAILDATGQATSYVTTANSFYSQITSATNQCSQWRVVSAGYRFFTTQAWSTAAGVLTVSEISSNYQPSVLPNVNSMNLGVTMKATPLRDSSVQTIFRPRGIESEDYENTYGADLGFTSSILCVYGASASTIVGTIEVVINYEWIPTLNSGFSLLATNAATHIPAVMDARTNLAQKVAPIQGGSTLASFKSTMDDANKSLNEAAAIAATGVSMYNTAKRFAPLAKVASSLLL